MLCSPSAKKADEDLIIGRKREIVTRSCTARPVGCGVGVIATIRDPASHLLSTAFPIYPFTRLLSPVPADSGLGRKLLADSFAIYARVLEAIYNREGVDNSYVSRMINLTCLAPDIVAAILDDTLPDHVTLFDLAVDPPRLWEAQRKILQLDG